MTDPYLEELRQRYPGYDNFTPSDFSRLDPRDLRAMNAVIVARSQSLREVIPHAFFERYGDDAYVQFARAVARQARRLGDPDLMSRTVLENMYGRSLEYGAATYTYPDGTTVTSTAPGIYSAQMAYEAANGRDATAVTVAVPKDALRAMRRDNPDRVPQSAIDSRVGMGIGMHDEAGYLAGYYAYGSPNESNPSYRGAGSNVVQIVPNYDRDAAARAFPQAASQIHNPSQPDLPVAYGYVAGYSQAEIDARYGYRNTDDFLYDQSPAPTPTPAPSPSRNAAPAPRR